MSYAAHPEESLYLFQAGSVSVADLQYQGVMRGSMLTGFCGHVQTDVNATFSVHKPSNPS